MESAVVEGGGRLGRLVDGVLGLVQNGLMVFAWMALAAGSVVPASAMGWTGLVIALTMPFLGWLASVAVHELGHVVGARWGGMSPYSIMIGPLHWWASSDGWRMRLQRANRYMSGFVRAHIDPDRPLKAQSLRMIIGGPLANLVLAGIAALVFLYLSPNEWSAFALGLAVFSACLGIANLVPRGSRFLDNDGLQILNWMRGRYESEGDFRLARLNGMSVKGVPADQLPPALVDGLAEVPVIGPLVRLWFILKAHQNAGEWQQAAAIAPDLESCVDNIPDEYRRDLDLLVNQMRTEMAFSNAMVDGVATDSIDRFVSRQLDWLYPALRPRCRALMAALEGDHADARRQLELSERKMARSRDLSYPKSERAIRQAICERLGIW